MRSQSSRSSLRASLQWLCGAGDPVPEAPLISPSAEDKYMQEIKKWTTRLREESIHHRAQAKKNKLMYFVCGFLPISVLSVATSIVSQSEVSWKDQAVLALSSISSVIAGISAYWNWGELAEKHANAAKKVDGLLTEAYTLKYEIHNDMGQKHIPQEWNKFTDLSEKYSTLKLDIPPLSAKNCTLVDNAVDKALHKAVSSAAKNGGASVLHDGIGVAEDVASVKPGGQLLTDLDGVMSGMSLSHASTIANSILASAEFGEKLPIEVRSVAKTLLANNVSKHGEVIADLQIKIATQTQKLVGLVSGDDAATNPEQIQANIEKQKKIVGDLKQKAKDELEKRDDLKGVSTAVKLLGFLRFQEETDDLQQNLNEIQRAVTSAASSAKAEANGRAERAEARANMAEARAGAPTPQSAPLALIAALPPQSAPPALPDL